MQTCKQYIECSKCPLWVYKITLNVQFVRLVQYSEYNTIRSSYISAKDSKIMFAQIVQRSRVGVSKACRFIQFVRIEAEKNCPKFARKGWTRFRTQWQWRTLSATSLQVSFNWCKSIHGWYQNFITTQRRFCWKLQWTNLNFDTCQCQIKSVTAR